MPPYFPPPAGDLPRERESVCPCANRTRLNQSSTGWSEGQRPTFRASLTERTSACGDTYKRDTCPTFCSAQPPPLHVRAALHLHGDKSGFATESDPGLLGERDINYMIKFQSRKVTVKGARDEPSLPTPQIPLPGHPNTGQLTNQPCLGPCSWGAPSRAAPGPSSSYLHLLTPPQPPRQAGPPTLFGHHTHTVIP